MSPQRIQLRRTKGWRKPEGAVVVSRPSVWGNQFKPIKNHYDDPGYRFRIIQVGAPFPMLMSAKYGGEFLNDALGVAVDLYRASIFRWIEDEFDGDACTALADLRGRDLACWCPFEAVVNGVTVPHPCHGDVLLELANAQARPVPVRTPREER